MAIDPVRQSGTFELREIRIKLADDYSQVFFKIEGTTGTLVPGWRSTTVSKDEPVIDFVKDAVINMTWLKWNLSAPE